jgi:hypothetical protein
MILNLIQSYISSKETDLNNYLGSPVKLKQIQTELDLELIGASESFINYQLYVTDIEKGNTENQRVMSVKVKLDFVFFVANKDYTIYSKILDRYIYGLFRIFKDKSNSAYTDTTKSAYLRINNLTDLSVSNADNFEDEYYRPTIEFTLQIIDKTNMQQTILNSETI